MYIIITIALLITINKQIRYFLKIGIKKGGTKPPGTKIVYYYIE